MSNENLLVLIGEQLYTLQQALPHILSIAAFGRALPANTNNRVYAASSSTDNLAADSYSNDNTDNTQQAVTATAATTDIGISHSVNTNSDAPESKQQQQHFDSDVNCETRSSIINDKQDASTTDVSEVHNYSSVTQKPLTPVASTAPTVVTASPALSWSGWLVDRMSNSTKAASDTGSSKLLERKRSKSKMSTAVRQVRTLIPSSDQLKVSSCHTYIAHGMFLLIFVLCTVISSAAAS
jgi:Lipin/Ned1/Smp2 multi-domain protein middle domain